MTSEQPSEPAQQPSQIDLRRIGVTALFLLITLILVFLSSQLAIYFIDRSQIAGGIFSRFQADYGGGVSISLAPLDRDRIIAEIISDEQSLTAQNRSPLVNSIVIALLPRITPQLSPALASPTPVPATIVAIAPASPTPVPVILPTATPSPLPTTLAPSPSPTSAPTSITPPTPTATNVMPPTPTATKVVPLTPTPTNVAPATPTATNEVPSIPTSTSTSSPTQSPSTPTATSVSSTPENDPPQADDDAAQLDEDATLVIDVLANDTDPDGALDLTSLSVVIQPSHGTAAVVTGTLVATPTIVYSPVPNYSGTDTFTYQVCDLVGACSRAVVTLTVIGVNDAPVVGGDNVEVEEDTPVDINVLSNDSDVDNDPLSIDSVGTPTSGAAAVQSDDFIRYTPNTDFSGKDSFTYVVSDGILTDTGTVFVTVLPVNDAPVAVDDSVFTGEDSPEDIPVRLNDFDVDGDMLTVVATGQPLNGTTTTNGSSVIYTPFPNYHGTDVFTYTISDRQASDSAIVTVTVISINDRPTAVKDVYTTTVDTALVVDDPKDGVLANDRDPEETDLTATLISTPTNGILLQFNSDGTFRYMPDTDFKGIDTFTYEASDGAAFSAPATVTVDVMPSD